MQTNRCKTSSGMHCSLCLLLLYVNKTSEQNKKFPMNFLSLIAAMASQEKSKDGYALPFPPDPKKIKLSIPGKCNICQTEKPSDILRKGKD